MLRAPAVEDAEVEALAGLEAGAVALDAEVDPTDAFEEVAPVPIVCALSEAVDGELATPSPASDSPASPASPASTPPALSAATADPLAVDEPCSADARAVDVVANPVDSPLVAAAVSLLDGRTPDVDPAAVEDEPG